MAFVIAVFRPSYGNVRSVILTPPSCWYFATSFWKAGSHGDALIGTTSSLTLPPVLPPPSAPPPPLLHAATTGTEAAPASRSFRKARRSELADDASKFTFSPPPGGVPGWPSARRAGSVHRLSPSCSQVVLTSSCCAVAADLSSA